MRKREKGIEWVVEGGILYEKEPFVLCIFFFFFKEKHIEII